MTLYIVRCQLELYILEAATKLVNKCERLGRQKEGERNFASPVENRIIN